MTSAFNKTGLRLELSPSTEARLGLQQQWPSSTQQAIEQTTGELMAKTSGPETEPKNKTIAAHSARIFDNGFWQGPLTGSDNTIIRLRAQCVCYCTYEKKITKRIEATALESGIIRAIQEVPEQQC